MDHLGLGTVSNAFSCLDRFGAVCCLSCCRCENLYHGHRSMRGDRQRWEAIKDSVTWSRSLVAVEYCSRGLAAEPFLLRNGVTVEMVCCSWFSCKGKSHDQGLCLRDISDAATVAMEDTVLVDSPASLILLSRSYHFNHPHPLSSLLLAGSRSLSADITTRSHLRCQTLLCDPKNSSNYRIDWPEYPKRKVNRVLTEGVAE